MNGRTNAAGGGSKPKNSVKVQEIAGELIPPNYFVSKFEGIASETIKQKKIGNSYFVNDDVYVVIDGLNKTVTSYCNTEQKSTVDLPDTSTFDLYTISHLPSINSFILSIKTATGHNKYNGHYLFSYTEDGTITLKDYGYEMASGYYGLEFICGVYPENFVYAINNKTLYRYNVVNQKLMQQSSVELEDLIFPSSSIDCASYYEEYGIISLKTNKWYRVEPSSGQILWSVQNDAFLNDYDYSAVYGNGTIKNGCLYRPQHSSSSVLKWIKIALDTGEFSVVSINVPSPFDNVYKYIKATFDNLYEEGNKFIGVLAEGNNTSLMDYHIFYVDLDNNTMEIEVDNLNTYGYYGAYTYKIGRKCVRGTFRFVFYEVQTTSYYQSKLIDYNLPHIVIAEDTTVYGISAEKIQPYAKGKVYTVNANVAQKMSIYGLPEIAVNTIKNDSVDEIKNAVISGKENEDGIL